MLNQLKTMVFLGILTGLLMSIGGFFGGFYGIIMGLGLAAAMNMVAYFFSDKIVLRIYKAKPADELHYKFLHDIIADLAKKANIPKPKIYIIPTESANAFATGRSPEHAAVACTEGILKLMTKEELKGVLAHEISHVSNRDILIMAILAPFIAMMIQLAISRSREYQADASGAKLLGDGKALASALRKLEAHSKKNFIPFATESTAHLFISNPLKPNFLISLFQTPPPMESRIKKLESMDLE